MIQRAVKDYEGAHVEVCFERNAVGVEFVCGKLAAFSLPEVGEITAERLHLRLSGQKVLCVVMDGHTGFREALCRAGFPECLIDECFEEMIVPRAKNSNLMDSLHGQSSGFAHLLYAWTGLRTLPAKIKTRYSGKVFEGPTAKDVVSLFKRWVLGQ